MASTSIALSEISNKQAVLRHTGEGETVRVEFWDHTSLISQRTFSVSEAAEFGQRVSETGEWEGFPFGGIEIAIVQILGRRLKEFAEEEESTADVTKLPTLPNRD